VPSNVMELIPGSLIWNIWRIVRTEPLLTAQGAVKLVEGFAVSDSL
jgi:hypothetical protein